jgi:hypothetical protein
MNQRILELINEATSGPKWVPLYKIEELLEEIPTARTVQECLYIVEGEDDGSARLVMIRMKQHFGVE